MTIFIPLKLLNIVLMKFLTLFAALFISFSISSQTRTSNYHFKYKKGFYYLVNAKGKTIDNVPYGFATVFSEGLAVVEKDLKFGYIDTTGTVVIDLQFFDAGPFIGGKAYAFNGQGYGYIDKSGNFTIEEKYTYAQSFDGGFAKIQVANYNSNQFGKSKTIFGLIDKDGNLLGNRYFSNISLPDEAGVFKGSSKDSVFTVHPNGTIEFIELKEKTDKNEPHLKRSEMPQYPGGENGLRKYIGRSVKYPKSAQHIKLQERVFISFIVDKEGNIKDVRPAAPKAPILMQEGLRVVSNMPQWKPGNKDGEPVNVSYTIPINFVLQ